MKNFLCITIIIITAFVIAFDYRESKTYRVLKINDDCSLSIDINKNLKAEENEAFQIPYIKTFCNPDNIKEIPNHNVLSVNAEIYLERTAKQYFHDYFLNSKITFQETNNEKLIFANGHNASILLLKKGLALANDSIYEKYNNFDEINRLIKTSEQEKFYKLNSKSLVLHRLDCTKITKSPNIKVISEKELLEKYKPCKVCNPFQPKPDNNNEYKPVPKDTVYSSANSKIEIITIHGYDRQKPSDKCDNKACIALKNLINSAQKTIDVAIYEFSSQPELYNAIINAGKRGVKVRIATDIEQNGDYKIYDDLKQKFLVVNDKNVDTKRLMHNKFVIVDGEKVFTGSANFTSTDIGGYNANFCLLIEGSHIAKLYENEFENFVKNRFHSVKTPTTENVGLQIDENNLLDIYFSPQDKIITNILLPKINNAKKYIYVPIFSFTHDALCKALIGANNRGVDVKIILDATTSKNAYSKKNELRKAGIPLKVENFGGKIHMKTIIIDDEYTLFGSMNFTKSGDVYNDENVVLVYSKPITEYCKKEFLQIWNKIPDTYLKREPRAEGFESIGSCYDGIDNNFDGKIDLEDDGCKAK